MEQAWVLLRCRIGPFAEPGVEPDVVVIASGRNERCLIPVGLGDRKPEQAAIEVQRTLQIGDLQVNMADARC